MELCFNKYAFGVPLSQEYVFVKSKVKSAVEDFLVKNFDVGSFQNSTYLELPDDYQDYCWIPWAEYSDESFDKIQFRRDLYTPFSLTSRDIEFYDGYEDLLSYRKSYFITFPIKYILKMCKKHFGNFMDKKCLVLGCGTGECLLMLEAYGIHADGLESAKYACENVNPMAVSRVKFCDFLSEIYSIESKKYDFVFTNILNWIDRRDISTILTEVNRISTMFITQYLSDGNSYKSKSKQWWQKQFTKAGMSVFPASARVAMCN